MILNLSSNEGVTAEIVKYNGSNIAEAISELENELTANNTRIYLDYKDGKYGYNTDPLRGADTFNPFSSGDEPVLLWTYGYPTANYEINNTTVELDLSEYKAVLITAKFDYTGGTKPTAFAYFRKDGKQYPLSVMASDTDIYFRLISVNDTSVNIGWCRYRGSVENYKCIPLKIYGLTQDISENIFT